jgi:hypothetical protein
MSGCAPGARATSSAVLSGAIPAARYYPRGTGGGAGGGRVAAYLLAPGRLRPILSGFVLLLELMDKQALQSLA